MEPTKRKAIREALKQVAIKHLNGKDAILNANALWVQGRICDIINPYLQDMRADRGHPGSAYELTALPGKSAYDLQFYLKINGNSRLMMQDCGVPGWKMIKGGPQHYLDNEGFLSANQVRRDLQKCIMQAFAVLPSANDWDPEIIYHENLVVGGADTTFRLKRKSKYFYNVEVVAVIKASDLVNGQGYDLVAKPLDSNRPDIDGRCWRMSWSVSERELLHSFLTNRDQMRKLTLLRLMKVIKNSHAGLEKLPSFFYLNALFWLHERYPDDQYWKEEQFANRFIDLMQLIRDALDTRDLRVYFDGDLKVPSATSYVSPALEYLNQVIQSQNYMALISPTLR